MGRHHFYQVNVISIGKEHACHNYPLCGNGAFRRNQNGKRARSLHCSECLGSKGCIFDGCLNPRAPLRIGGRSSQYCAEHYRDPAFGEDRAWKLCANSKIGCTQLAATRRGGKCYACLGHNLPCLHATMGCTRRVRCNPDEPPRKRPTCSSRESWRCFFDPLHSSACATTRCGNLCVNGEKICDACSSGCTPCSNKCTRRAVPELGGYCAPCSARVGTFSAISPSSSSRLDVAPVTSHNETLLQVSLTSPSHAATSAVLPHPLVLPTAMSTVSTRDLDSIPTSQDGVLLSPSLRSSAHGNTLSLTDTTVTAASAPLPYGHAPRLSCRNFPVCSRQQKQLFAPRSNSKDKQLWTGRSLFCASCEQALADGTRCLHSGCVNPVAPTRLRQGPHMHCAQHLADPAYTSKRSWGLCSHSDEGCKFLTLKPLSGKCYACTNSFLPCVNALAGCPRHVQHNPRSRKRRACSRHDNASCAFSTSTSYRRCSSDFCANTRDSLDDSLCATCRKGYLPCVNMCTRRTLPNSGIRCQFSQDDSSKDSQDMPSTEQSPPHEQQSCEPAAQCATKGCSTLVLCNYGSLPCMPNTPYTRLKLFNLFLIAALNCN